jgi:hypothetical protein
MVAPEQRPTSWWLEKLRHRAVKMYDEKLKLDRPIEWASEEERRAAIAFFNAAFRAEESGLTQAHQLADEIAARDPELAEVLRLYGNEEGWHRELLTEFLQYLGGEVTPMGPITTAFYKLYGRAKRVETIVLTNLMFETIGSTTYRLALRRARHPAVRQMLQILTRDESFHVPLNVHFMRQALALNPEKSRTRMKLIYHLLYVTLILSSLASRRKAKAFDQIPFRELSRAYAEHLGRLFLHESDFQLKPPEWLLRLFGMKSKQLVANQDLDVISVRAAERSWDREKVAVSAL